MTDMQPAHAKAIHAQEQLHARLSSMIPQLREVQSRLRDGSSTQDDWVVIDAVFSTAIIDTELRQIEASEPIL